MVEISISKLAKTSSQYELLKLKSNRFSNKSILLN